MNPAPQPLVTGSEQVVSAKAGAALGRWANERTETYQSQHQRQNKDAPLQPAVMDRAEQMKDCEDPGENKQPTRRPGQGLHGKVKRVGQQPGSTPTETEQAEHRPRPIEVPDLQRQRDSVAGGKTE